MQFFATVDEIMTTESKNDINLEPGGIFNSTNIMDKIVLEENSYEINDMFKYVTEFVEFNEEEEDEEHYKNCIGPNQDNEVGEDDEERDLTNLTWLTELRNQTIGFVNIARNEEWKKSNESTLVPATQITVPLVTPNFNHMQKKMLPKATGNVLAQQRQNIILQMVHKSQELHPVKVSNQHKRPSPAERYEIFLEKIKRDLEIYQQSAMDYQSDSIEKPPFNYSHIIGMAMLENDRRVTLQQICSWIERKFAFFRVRKKWNNSIRHNLSLHPCFRKIGRNKEDKGKGGYWELGVDPKKFDRKRIRNRRPLVQTTQIPKKYHQAHYLKTKKRQQKLQNSNLLSTKKLNFKQSNDSFKILSSNMNSYEEILLDDMDVQQNVDVASSTGNNSVVTTTDICYNKNSSMHSNASQLCEAKKKGNNSMLIRNYINDGSINMHKNIEFIVSNKSHFDTTNHNYGDKKISNQSSQQLKQHQNVHQLHYKFGTVIISSINGAGELSNIQNIKPGAFNLFAKTNPSIQQQTTIYTEDDARQNESASLYISDLSEDHAKCTHVSKKYYHNNPESICSSSLIALDFSAFSAQSIQPKPNVTVEQLIQPPLNFSSSGIQANIMSTSASVSSTEYSHEMGNENFRPYIDGIDEAFQYLRSIDNTRNEDLLDNLLDISVNDY